MSEQKKSWQRPQLIVLARANPQEAVLTHCKTISQWRFNGPGLQTQQDCCGKTLTANCCVNCQTRAVNAT